MELPRIDLDLSVGTVCTALTQERLPADNARTAAMRVYADFSSDAPIQQHIMEFAAAMTDQLPGDTSLVNTFALKRFDYLASEQLRRDSLLIKGSIALNMVRVELEDGDLYAELVEPFEGITILPTLYEKWRQVKSVDRFAG